LCLILAISSLLLVDFSNCQELPEPQPLEPAATQGNQIDTQPQDVLDTGAWLAYWLAAVGSYAGRQEQPWMRRYRQPLDDLPDIYIPNELTGNQIVKALKLTGKKQMVIEENEYRNYYRFLLMQKDVIDQYNDTSEYSYSYDTYETGQVFNGPRSEPRQSRTAILAQYFDEEDGNLVLSENFINQTKAFLISSLSPHSDPEALSSLLGDNVIEALLEILRNSRVPLKSIDSWDDMVSFSNERYQQMMSILEKKNLVEETEDGFYKMTSSGTETIHNALNETILQAQTSLRFPDWQDDYRQNKAHGKFMERFDQMIQASADILHLPTELSWSNIKAAIQSIYKTAIPRVNLYQFLFFSRDYLEIDTDVEGMSKLSPFVTQLLIDEMWGMFGYNNPLRG